MEDKLHEPSILLNFLLLFSSYMLLSSAYTPPDKYFINCGSNINLDITSQTYVGDMNSGLVSFTTQNSFIFDNKQASKAPLPLYQTARIFKHESSYEFEIDSNGPYLVRLHFFDSKNLSAAGFDVSASGFMLLHNFTLQNSSETAVIEEFILYIPRGDFSIYFVPRGSSFAFVNAIEVFLAPPDFINDEDSNGFKGIHSQALHTVHRINVGGPTLTPQNDTLFRKWLPDDSYLYNADTAKNAQDLTLQPNYSAPVNQFIAPDFVYMTAKEMNINTSRKSNNFNITWSYHVTRNARHLVRVHFCDLVSSTPNKLQFLLYIDSNLCQKINPSERMDQLSTPVFIDFVLQSDDSGFMNISIGPDSSSLLTNAFLNGVEIMQMIVESDFVKSKQKSAFVIVCSVVGGLVLVLILGGLFFIRSRHRKLESVETLEWPPLTTYEGNTHGYRKMPGLSTHSREGIINASPVPDFNLGFKIPFSEIQLATNSFDTKLQISKGRFGNVYRGTLRNGIEVAVKRSEPGSGQGLPEFQTEIMILSRIRHRHLVSLIGYCDERFEMILVYEFMEKGTLREHLYNSKMPCLSWKQRLEICIGAARGLNYLHNGATAGIIHRNVNSTNILIDENLVAKVADFGLSKSGPHDQSHVITDVRGTFGYLDAEYFRTQQLTEKSDVYSFGVVLLEVLCARPAIDPTLPREQMNLAEWGLLCKKKGLLDQILDPFIKPQIIFNSLRKYAEIAEKCLQEDAADRPTMSDVAWDLEYVLLLQQTAVVREPHEDSTSNASGMLPLGAIQSLPSMTAEFYSDEMPIIREDDSDTLPSASEVFSQLRINNAR